MMEYVVEVRRRAEIFQLAMISEPLVTAAIIARDLLCAVGGGVIRVSTLEV